VADDDRPPEEWLLQASIDAVRLATGVAKWWTKTLVESAGANSWESADAIAQAFRGRAITFDVGGRRLTAVLSRIELRPGGDRGARLELTDVNVDGVRVPSILVNASEVTFEPPPDLGLLLAGVEVSGEIPVSELVAWADRQTPDWDLKLVDGGRISAQARADGRQVIAVPTVIAGRLELEIRHVAWRGIGLDLPRWLKMTHRVPLPSLPDGVSILHAAREGDAVDFRLAVNDVRRKLDLRAAFTKPATPPG
jgi:hypothetical protein